MNNSERVLRNTVVMYSKVIISTLIWLYLIRVVLNTLGVEDYGIYSLIAGVVAILSFVNSALMASTQRFLSFSIGARDEYTIKKYFSSSVIIHVCVALIIVGMLEFCAQFLFNGFLNIPTSRISVAKDLYQLMIVSTFFTILGVPYSAAINAFEDIWFSGVVQIVGTILKLFIIVLFSICEIDKLLLFTLWITFITVLEVIVQYLWCKWKYPVCCKNNYSLRKSKSYIREMIGFTGWNTLGAFAVVGRNQGITTVLNVFFGPKINAVFGIANQVDGQLVSFANTLTAAMTPQIIKSEGSGNRERLISLTLFSSKLAFFLSSIFAIPLLIELPFVLKLWLKEVPPHTEIYCRLILFMFLICELYPGLLRGIQAVGKIKWQQILTSVAVLSPIPIGILFFRLGAPHYSIAYLMVIAQLFSGAISVFFSHKYYGLNIKKYLSLVLSSVFSFVVSYFMGYELDEILVHMPDSLRFMTVVSLSAIAFIFMYFIFCFSKHERSMILQLSSKIFKSR